MRRPANRLFIIHYSFFIHWVFRPAPPTHPAGRQAQVVNVENPAAISDFQPNAAVVQGMVDCGITALTGKTNVTAAWRSLVSTQDVVGIKVFSEPGMLSGTRPAVVGAVIHGLLAAGVPPEHIIIWDKHDVRFARRRIFQSRRATRRARGRQRGNRL